MFSTINNVSRKINGTLSKIQNRSVRIALGVAAAGGLARATSALGAFSDVTGITTTYVAGTPTTVSSVSGAGTSTTGFLTTNTYTIKYAGGDLELNSLKTATATYVPTATATVAVQRNGVDANNDILWYANSGNTSTANGSTINLEGPQLAGYSAALSGNNLLVGGDNVFNNQSNDANNNTDVERLDFIYSGGIKSGASNAFTVFDRGQVGQHDGFKIAAITGYNPGTGMPTSYGTLLTLTTGSWGNTALIAEQGYTILRANNSTSPKKYHPSDHTVQTLGGVVIPTTSLAAPGATIYGYSLFATDVTGSGAQLLNVNNSTYFPTNTTEKTGGLDPLATSVLLTTAVPEPTTAALGLVGAALFLGRRGKRSLA